MNPFELITAECYEDNSITRSFISYVNDYTCYLYVALSYTENNSWSMSLHDIWVHQANIIRDICKRLIGVEPAPVKQKPRKKLWRNIWVQNGYQNARNGALFRSCTKHLILVFYVKRFYQYFYITVSYFQACNFTRKLFHTVKSF